MTDARKPYPSDMSDEEWPFAAPYLSLLPLDAQQRRYVLREVFTPCVKSPRAARPGTDCRIGLQAIGFLGLDRVSQLDAERHNEDAGLIPLVKKPRRQDQS